jgi:hypothetical protein
MTKQTKIILAVVGGVLVLCMISCVVGFFLLRAAGSTITQNVTESVEKDPAKVQRVGDEIADLDIPAGYDSATSMDIFGMKMVIWENTAEQSTIMLIQMPMQVEISDDIIRQMEDSMRRQSSRDLSNLRTVEERDLTVRGQPARLIVMEGDDEETGAPFQQVLVAFQGKGGMALLMMMNPDGGQNMSSYEELIESIR